MQGIICNTVTQSPYVSSKMEIKRAAQYLNINRTLLINPFILGGLTGGISGNLSLGLVTGGLTVLVWGFSPGMNFIALTTIFLVLMTGNINLELIFIFVLSLAYLFRARGRGGGFWLLSIPVLLSYPLWKLLLGFLPAGLLNEFNISGQILLIAGSALTLLRGYRSANHLEAAGFCIKLLTIFLALQASSLTIPCWLAGSLLLPGLKGRFCSLSPLFWKRVVSLAVITVSLLLLPGDLYLAALLGIGFISFSGWPEERLPLMELVYLAVILGIFGSRVGLFI